MPIVLVQVILALLVVGVVLWGLSQLPIDPAIGQFIRVAVIVVVAIWLVYLLAGILGAGPGIVIRH